MVTNSCGDQMTQTALVYCDQLPAILSQPQDVTVFTGTPEVELTIGIPPFFSLCLGNTYAWSDATNMVSLSDGDEYLGTTTRKLTIINPQGPSVTDYFCEITNQCGSILTRLARVTVLVPPPPAPRIATLDWLHDAFPFNETLGLPGTAAFDTATALLKSGRNIAQLTGDENRFDIPGDSLVVCECHDSVRVDLVFRILPGPGNYATLGSRNSGLRRVPTSAVVATAGDGSFWGQYLADNGLFGSPGGHAGGQWDPNVWNSARMDTAEINLWPISGLEYFSARDSCRWSGTYHEADPKYASLGIAKSRCFLRSPAGPFDSSNITCDRVGDPTTGWETAGGGYVPEGGLPSGHTLEYTKIIPDGQLTPGTHVEYFIRVSHIAYPTSFSITPDTNLVTPQPNEIVSNIDACGSVSGPGATDGHRWQQFSVLPDRWKSATYGGLGSACMLYIDMDDGLGDERAWVTAANLIGATLPAKWGAHNGWHIDHLGDDPNDPEHFVRPHGGQPGTTWDMYGVRGVIDPIRGCAGSLGDRLANRASMGLAANKYSRLGPTPEMLRAYYKLLYITTGRFDRQILGPFNDRSQNDVAILSNFWAQSSFTSCGALVEGESFAESELAAGTQHSILVNTLFGTNSALPSYTLATAPAYIACPDVLQNVGSLGTYGVANVVLPDNDVLTKTNFAYTQDASFFQNIGTNGPYVASTLTLPHVAGSVPINWTGMLDAWDVQDFGTRFCAPPGNGRLSYLRDVFKNIFGDLCDIVPSQLVGVDPTIAASVESPDLRVLGNPTSGGQVRLALRMPFRGPIHVTICDLAGRRLRSLVDQFREAGSYTIPWDARDDQGHAIRPGMYFVRARLPGMNAELTRSLVILR